MGQPVGGDRLALGVTVHWKKGWRNMPRGTQQTQGITALEHTKRGYGLWRGEVIHPDDPRMDEIIASGYPITDTKGFGLHYVPVRGAGRIAHFRAHDP
jgi:hypothetical protein